LYIIRFPGLINRKSANFQEMNLNQASTY